jgi:hypothetical protein
MFLKTCKECGADFHGRANKEYCSMECKSAHNNGLIKSRLSFATTIESKLRNNRMILQALLQHYPEGAVSKDVLENEGYEFQYLTHWVRSEKHGVGRVCYDHVIYNKDEVYLIKKGHE